VSSPPPIHVSVVSHRHGALVGTLLEGLAAGDGPEHLTVTLTVNVPEPLALAPQGYGFPLQLRHNAEPRGFGANHNAAFRSQDASRRSPFYCVLNPDTRVAPQVLQRLAGRLSADPGLGVVAPLVRDPSGAVEDSMRRVPSPWTLARKLLGGRVGNEYVVDGGLFHPDWVAGICMVFPSSVYARLGGFDERYWLYYEDVDLCCRLRAAGYTIAVDPGAAIVHDARRASRSDARMFGLHARSVLRFFSSATYRRCRRISRVRGQLARPST